MPAWCPQSELLNKVLQMYHIFNVLQGVFSSAGHSDTYWIQLEKDPNVSSLFAPKHWVLASQNAGKGSVFAGWFSQLHCLHLPWLRWNCVPPSCSVFAPTACFSSWAVGGPRSERRWRWALRRWSSDECLCVTTGAPWVPWCPHSLPLWWIPGTVVHKHASWWYTQALMSSMRYYDVWSKPLVFIYFL